MSDVHPHIALIGEQRPFGLNGADAGASVTTIPSRLIELAASLSVEGWPVGIVTPASGTGQYWAVIAATEKYGLWFSVDLDLLALSSDTEKFIRLEGAAVDEGFEMMKDCK